MPRNPNFPAFKDEVLRLWEAGLQPPEIRKSLGVRPHKVYYALKKLSIYPIKQKTNEN